MRIEFSMSSSDINTSFVGRILLINYRTLNTPRESSKALKNIVLRICSAIIICTMKHVSCSEQDDSILLILFESIFMIN